MADVFSYERRSEIMSRIRAKDTKPEIRIRSMLHRLGYRFRLNVSGLPGKPDIVLPKYKTVIFVHGCFWHRHEGCKFAYTPKTREEFWLKKFITNIARDQKTASVLKEMGWQVVTVWECELRAPSLLLERLNRTIKSSCN